MASEVRTNKISPATGTAFTIGDSGDTFTLPSGATLAVSSGATISNAGTASGFGGTNTPYFKAYLTGSQSVSSGVVTKVQFQTEELDPSGIYDNATNYRFTVPAGAAGLWQINAHFSAGSGSINSSSCAGYLYVNGTVRHYSLKYKTTGNMYWHNIALVTIFDLSEGDYVEVFVNVNGTSPEVQGNNNDNRSSFSGFKLVQ